MARFNEAVFAASHNSFSGAPGGAKGPLAAQLDAGVRMLELDVHDSDFRRNGYRIGHGGVGDEVEHSGGNPRGNALGAWLRAIVDWSTAHDGHAPIVVTLDLKGSLTDNPSYADGNLGRLNAELRADLPRLLTAAETGGQTWPEVDEIRNRMLVVLSGHQGTRRGYVRDPGQHPAVAVSEGRQLIEVHDSGAGHLWYWTGKLVSTTEALWYRHSRYDTGDRPAVAVNGAGIVVEVHQDPDPGDDTLWYRVGRLSEDGEIDWSRGGGRKFPNSDRGRAPTVRFIDQDHVREIHESPRTGRHWYWDGTLASNGTVDWTRSDGGETDAPLFDKTRDTTGRMTIQVTAQPHGSFAEDVLLYRAGGASARRICYEQVAFIEAQHGDDDLGREGAWFFAVDAAERSQLPWIEGWRQGGRLTRRWGFDSERRGGDPPVNFAATDEPLAAWYQSYCASIGAVA